MLTVFTRMARLFATSPTSSTPPSPYLGYLAVRQQLGNQLQPPLVLIPGARCTVGFIFHLFPLGLRLHKGAASAMRQPKNG